MDDPTIRRSDSRTERRSRDFRSGLESDVKSDADAADPTPDPVLTPEPIPEPTFEPTPIPNPEPTHEPTPNSTRDPDTDARCLRVVPPHRGCRRSRLPPPARISIPQRTIGSRRIPTLYRRQNIPVDKPATSRLPREESDKAVTMTGFQSSRSFHHVMSLGRSGSGLLKSGDGEDRTPYRVHSCESRPCPDHTLS